MPNSVPILSVALSHAELIRLVSPRILSQYPSAGIIEHWVIDIVQLKGGLRFDLIAPGEARR
ncbi:MAG TPA: hypothetical protein VGV37_13365 [Aliidongia sp.]|uniref:hypothetical protein n=1 Tax=Aliidongia sp. TaxID=1914230 RepID=UPI002DDD39AC|nr:hypothetical protein [Aliidongia sp.]HEV2675527.1 hypothetical protein [Aliidongia sp.]